MEHDDAGHAHEQSDWEGARLEDLRARSRLNQHSDSRGTSPNKLPMIWMRNGDNVFPRERMQPEAWESGGWEVLRRSRGAEAPSLWFL